WVAIVLGITLSKLPPHPRPSPRGRGEQRAPPPSPGERGGSIRASLVPPKLFRIGCGLGAIVLAIGLAWFMSLPEAAYEAVALCGCLWTAYCGVARFRENGDRAKFYGLLIVGLAVTAAVSAVVFRPVDRECLWMIAGCLTMSLAIWS